MTTFDTDSLRNPPLVTLLTWCLACQRVSWARQFEGIYWACPYEDCEYYADKAHQDCIRGAAWEHIREKYHPEFPAIPRQGVVYPAPTFLAHILSKEPGNAFLRTSADAAFMEWL